MKLLIKKAAVCTIALLLFCGFSMSAYASENYGEEASSSEVSEAAAVASAAIPAKSGMLMEQSTGRILFEKNAKEKMPPASITKIMTLLLVMEAIENGSVKLEDKVTASAYACSMGGSQIWLKENEVMTVDELLRATAIASANDAAMALAELVGGSEEGFVSMMNNKAAELGMADTTFKNPTGLDAEGHLSTAQDVAIMSRALLSHKKITEYTTVWMDSLRDGKTELVNTNKLVKFYKGCTGLKTGTTNGAGSCVSVSAVRDGMGLISVVMGCATSKERFDSARTLLDLGFSAFTVYNAEVTPDMLVPIAVKGGVAQEVSIALPQSVPIVMEKGDIKSIEKTISLPESVTAPVKAGQKIGEVIFSSNSNELVRIPLTAAENVEEMTLFKAFGDMLFRLVTM